MLTDGRIDGCFITTWSMRINDVMNTCRGVWSNINGIVKLAWCSKYYCINFQRDASSWYICMTNIKCRPWWRHQMETFSALLALCAGNSPVTGEIPSQRPVTRSFDVFINQFAIPEACKNWLGLVNNCIYYTHHTHAIYQVLAYSVDFKAHEKIWNPLSKSWLVVLFGMKDL